MSDTIRSIIFGIGAILFLWFLAPLVITRNFNIGAVTGMGVSALLMLYMWQMPGIHRLFSMLWKQIVGRIFLILLIVLCSLVLCLAIATAGAMISGLSKSPTQESTVVVLGARVYENRVSSSLRSRLDAAASYLKEHPDAVCIVSGGQGKDEPCTESSLMYEYLLEQGIEAERIFQEDRSTDTQENLLFSKEIIEAENLNPNLALVTNGYHAYRAIHYAKEVGLSAGAVPAGTSWWIWPASIIREMYGILELWFL